MYHEWQWNKIYTKFRHQTLKQMVHLEEKDLRGRIILKLICSNRWKFMDGICWTQSGNQWCDFVKAVMTLWFLPSLANSLTISTTAVNPTLTSLNIFTNRLREIFRRASKVAKSDYYLRYVCPVLLSLRPSLCFSACFSAALTRRSSVKFGTGNV